jgi:hypothetical protein
MNKFFQKLQSNHESDKNIIERNILFTKIYQD